MNRRNSHSRLEVEKMTLVDLCVDPHSPPYGQLLVTTRIPNFPYLTVCFCSVINGRKAVKERPEKSIFETPHNEIKCVLSIKESNFSGKNGSEVSHLLTVRAKGADPPPLTVSLTVKDPFFMTSL